MEVLLYNILAPLSGQNGGEGTDGSAHIFYSITIIYHLLTFTVTCCSSGIKEVLDPSRDII